MTVLFCDLVGSSRLSQELDPEDWLRLLHRLHSQCGDVIAAHHGHVAQYLGDGLLAYFGYPVATEDAPRSAAAAGLALAREAETIRVDAARNLQVRVGIHTGPVVVGNVGSRRHQESLALGEVPNLAARIQEVAPPGGVLVSPDTFRLIDAYFECRELPPARLKGFAEPIRLRELTKSRGPTTRLEARSAVGLGPLVGRSRELEVLATAWQKSNRGACPITLVVGEAGIGKSRLLHSLKETASDATSVIELRCSEHAKSTAFHPLVERLQLSAQIQHGVDSGVIRDKLGKVLEPAGVAPENVGLVASLFGAPPPPALPAQRVRAAILEALSTWLSKVEAGERRLVVIEDLHWADPSTLEVLKICIEQPCAGGLMLALSARPEFAPVWSTHERVHTVTLTRLQGEDTHALISHVTGNKAMPPEVVERLIQRAEGIPLFLEEMTKSVLESGALRETDESYVLERSVRDIVIPSTLHDSLMGRLDQLGQGKPVAQLAAVLGKEFGYPLFASVWRRIRSLPAVNLIEGLDRLVGAQVMHRQGQGPDSQFHFKHALLQQAAYESLLRSDRRQYHLATAEVLLGEFAARAELEPELVALHYSAADVHDSATEYWNLAGKRALAGSAYAEAISHFNSGLDQLAHLPEGPERLRREMDLRSSLGVSLITTHGFSSRQVEETFSRAAVLCGELGDEIPLRVLYGTWVVNLVRGDFPSTSRMVTNLERMAASPKDPTSELAVNAMLGAFSFFRGDYPKASTHCRAAWKLCEAESPKAQHEGLVQQHGFEGLLYPALYWSWALLMMGDIEAGSRTLGEARAMGQLIADPYVSVGIESFAAAQQHDLGDLVAAGELATRGRALAEQHGFVHWAAIATVVSGDALLAEGRADEACERMNAGLDLLRAVGDKFVYVYYLTYLAQALLAAGRPAQAKKLLDDGHAMTATHLTRFCEPEFLRLLGEMHAATGDWGAAAQSLFAASDLARSQGARLFELRTAISLVRLFAGRGEADRGRELLRQAREHFGSSAFPLLSQADELLGVN